MEQVGPLSVHHVSTRPPKDKQSLANEVFEQMRREFFMASPFTLHASVPETLAAVWVLIRETLMCGNAPRGRKEIIASGVSKANRCPFCEDAHRAAVIASRTSDARLAYWSEATGQASHPALKTLPFDTCQAEYIGTVVGFHYLNRVVSVFLDDKMMPVPAFLDRPASFMARIMMGGMLRKAAQNRPGQALHLIPDIPRTDAWRPAWASQNRSISEAISGWAAVNEYLAEIYLSSEVTESVGPVIDDWNGGEIYNEPDWLGRRRPRVADIHIPAVDLALMTAMAPFRITEAAVENVIKSGLSAEQVLIIVAWAAQRAARRAGDWTAAAAGLTPQSPLRIPRSNRRRPTELKTY